MGNITSFQGTLFTPSKGESVSFKTFGFWGLNIITLGLFETIRMIIKDNQIKRLTLDNKKVTYQAENTVEKSRQLEKGIKKILAQLSAVESGQNTESLENDLLVLTAENNQLALKKVIPGQSKLKTSFSSVVLNIFLFIGNLFVNICTVGVYGVSINHGLNNRVKFLQERKAFFETQSQKYSNEKSQELQSLINASQKLISNAKEMDALKKTDKGQLFVQVQNAQQEIQALKVQVQDKVNEVSQLNKEIKDVKAKPLAHPQEASGISKFASEIGPVPPKYTQIAEDGEVKGAMDGLDGAPAAQHDFINGYNLRYGDKYSASEIAAESFNYAYEELLKPPYKLNKSHLTCTTAGKFAIYRHMVLDLLLGAKVPQNDDCHGYTVQINENVKMLPSKPEKILHYKKEADGNLQPVIAFHYQQKDDFTPSEEALGMNGVDPLSAKWILEKLNDQEKKHLQTYLMSPIIENHHPDFKDMLAFMSNKSDSRVKLVKTAAELIEDMAIAFEKKFEKNVLIPCWQNNADEMIEPFVKKEDQDLLTLAKTDFKDPNEKISKWEIDVKVIGAPSSALSKAHKDFQQLITQARDHHQLLTHCIEIEKCLEKPEKEGKTIAKFDWKNINEHFHISHQMIGTNALGNGGVKCLYSNLLTVLLKDKNDLNPLNVSKLKSSMAAYLDQLNQAKKEWEAVKPQAAMPLSDDMQKKKAMAELRDEFEKECSSSYHKCSLANYQSWLRGQWGGKANGVTYIDQDQLTAFEIQLAAHTLGVRIGLFLFDAPCACKVDKLGRIVPSEVYGPNTKELLLLGLKNNSFYGLQPKLHVTPELLNTGDQNKIDTVLNHENYWKAVKPK